MVRLVSWNVGHSQPWEHLDGVDVALLQELRQPPAAWGDRITPSRAEPWATAGYQRRPFRAAVVRVSDAVTLNSKPMGDMATADPSAFAVSRPGSLAAADVLRDGAVLFTAISMYAAWETAEGHTTIYADASAHRIISDVATLVHNQNDHCIVAAGDLNILRGYGEDGSRYWATRYKTVFDRLEAMGVTYVGPSVKEGVRQAEPWPDELPPGSPNVPTYYSSHQTPASARRQLDFVFASRSIADRVNVTARNQIDD